MKRIKSTDINPDRIAEQLRQLAEDIENHDVILTEVGDRTQADDVAPIEHSIELTMMLDEDANVPRMIDLEKLTGGNTNG